MPPTTPPPPLPTLSLIVVEDSRDDFDVVVARVAAEFGSVHAVRVESREELVAALGAGSWSAVVADHRLPRMSSLDALEIVREQAPDLPFVIVSGAIGEQTAVDALHAGADDYVMKDSLSRLPRALSRALESVRLRRLRRAAEEALIESEARYRALAANLPGMVFQAECANGQLSFPYTSDGARRLFGVDGVALERERHGWLGHLAPGEGERLAQRLADVESLADEQVVVLWIDDEVRSRAEDEAGPRWLQVTARARRERGRVLWDGIVTDITRQKRMDAALRESQAELRELAGNLVRVREDERAAIAREIHDDIGSTLTGLKFQHALLKSKVAKDPALAAALRETEPIVDAAIAASNRIMHDLRPPILDEGIVAALEWQVRTFERRTGLVATLAAPESIPLAPAAAIVVFRICQESLNNVVKHAQATSVSVRLALEDGELSLEVVDDGRGIDPDADPRKPGHFGLKGMRERAYALGGHVTVTPSVDGGTRVLLKLPLSASDLATEGATT